MSNLISVLFVILSTAYCQTQNVTTYNSNHHFSNTFHPDLHTKLIAQQYDNYLKDYDYQVTTFKKVYASQVDTINIQLNYLVDSLIKFETFLNTLEIVSVSSKECVSKYRSSISSVAMTKSEIHRCVKTANYQLDRLLISPIMTKNDLQKYYTNTFEKEVTNCDKKFENSSLNYTLCVTSVTSSTSSYTTSNQKIFNTQMDAAQCSANANIDKAMECSFKVQNQTIFSIAEVKTLINKCLLGLDDCSRCSTESSKDVLPAE